MRVRVQVQAHTILMPIPVAIDAMIAAIEHEDIADDAPLATVASDAATDGRRHHHHRRRRRPRPSRS